MALAVVTTALVVAFQVGTLAVDAFHIVLAIAVATTHVACSSIAAVLVVSIA